MNADLAAVLLMYLVVPVWLAILLVVDWHWTQAIFGLSSETARFAFEWKRPPLRHAYVIRAINGDCSR